MNRTRIVRSFAILVLGLGLTWACGFDGTLRAYLDARFWQPYAKYAAFFARKNVRRTRSPYAGMDEASGATTLAKLRAGYREISDPDRGAFVSDALHQSVAAALADKTLNARENEEVRLIDAKTDMREAEPDDTELLRATQRKLAAFLRTSRIPEFRSEARGWLAHVDYLLGDQTSAGKIYLDELNRSGSNLSEEVLLNSLKVTYGYDGGPELLGHLDEYFDTPEHAAFAIQLATNPHWDDNSVPREIQDAAGMQRTYAHIAKLLTLHSNLLQSPTGAGALAVLAMRTALRMGDPPGALKIAGEVQADSPARKDPDFNWILASALFLTHDYAGAQQPLLALYSSSLASPAQKASAAYGLCGVYSKIGNTVEQIRFALWLNTQTPGNPWDIEGQSIYWANSGFDLNLLLDSVASIDDITSFLAQYPNAAGTRKVKYSLAVRLSRENRYAEAARIYASISAARRALRTGQLSDLYDQATRQGGNAPQLAEAKYRLARFLSDNPDRIYFNDALWDGFQRYALIASTDSRLTRQERDALIAGERKLKDDQDERWRAYVLLREVAGEEGKTDLGRQSAQLAIRCLRGLSDRFGRQDDIRKADIELSVWLRQ